MARGKVEGKLLGPAKASFSYRETIEQERSARDSKTAKLRALRLAKEALQADGEPAGPKSASRRKGAIKRVSKQK